MSKPIQRSRGVRGSREVIRGGSDDDDDAPNNRDAVERLMKTQVAASTRNAYLQKQVQFIALLFEAFGLGDESVLRQSFFVGFPRFSASSVEWRSCLRKKLELYAANDPPLDLSRLTARLLGEMILKHFDGERQSLSSVGQWTAAVKDLFRSFHVAIPPNYDAEVALLVNGYSRDAAADRERNVVGKDALPFDLLCKISRATLTSESSDAIFAHIFLLLQWNLMCRSNNVELIHLAHLQWSEDRLLVYFRKQKNDQNGTRSTEPRSIYANPVKPEVCSILALGLFFVLFPPRGGAELLFPGKEQKQRFSKSLSRVLKSEGLLDYVRELGFDPKSFGTQSLRKGSSTFVSSGTTDAPSQMAINLRAGWTMTKIEKTYFRFERAGDQYVGRTVAGLPIHSAEFSILPPLWNESSIAAKDCIAEVMGLCFPEIAKESYTIVKNTMASVVFHVDWLRKTLPANHPLFSTRLFSSFDVGLLRTHIVCGLPSSDGDIQATGVPTHVALKVELAKIKDQQQALVQAVTEFKSEFGDTLRQGLNDFAVSQGHMTFDKFKDLLDNHLNVLDVRMREQLRSPKDVNLPASVVEANRQERKTFMWGGMLHLVPENFEFPSVTAQQAFILWACGSVEKDLPPFRFLTPHDMPSKNVRKRLSDFRTLMNILESGAKEGDACWPCDGSGKWKSSLSPAEANAVFGTVGKLISVPEETTKGRARRMAQMLWSSHLKAWQDHQKEIVVQSRRKKRDRELESEVEVEVDGEELEEVVRKADFDVSAAYERLLEYSSSELNLYENIAIEGDGACLFRTAAVQLNLARPERGQLSHERIRLMCVEWVLKKYGRSDADGLQAIGYKGWDDWRDKMSQRDYYGDELCVEAITALFNVRILIIFCGHNAPSHRFVGEEKHPVVYFGNVGDYHFYSFRPTAERKGQQRKRVHKKNK